ncbi:MAG: deoxynucleoside kinase [Calditrichaceae bacterium]|nr:deoxynucleoside kinase [Calditrichaceae bacterium]MBN2709065.1 deoxynucleoside kinase [Calditrichaceae bacterium]RQV97023.1 MAG: deoxynucleoside kinase [Calditrichota bacterium]
MIRKRKLYVAIAGNIGAGKTTLTRMLSEKLAWRAYYEKVIDNPYLSDFYADMERWSFHLQVYFLSHRFRSQKEISNWPDSCIQDRSIYEDVEIFARTLHAQGKMTDRDYHNYQDLFSIMVTYLRKPDVILYLKSPIELLLEHIGKRGREYEQSIDPGYLSILNNAYDDWIERAKKDNFHVVTFDMRYRDFEKNEKDFNIIYQSIVNLENQTWLDVV